MGISTDYSNVPDWVAKSEGYQTGEMVKYQGNIFYANFEASEPGVGDADHNGWRFYDELYDLTPHTPTAQAKIIAYVPTWRKRGGFNYADDEMYRYITHGIVSFLMFSEVNLGEFEPKSLEEVKAVLSDVVNTGHRNGTRILIALGGAVDYGFLNLMTSIGNNPDNPLLDLAVQNVVNFVKSNNLDGVDLDLECWWGKPGQGDMGGRAKADGPHPAGFALTSFAQKLKQAMPDKLVSAAIFGTSWYGNNYDPKLADYTDWLAIMTYDLTGSWNASPVGPQSALLKIRNQESYLREQQGKWPDPQNQDQGPVNNPILSVEDTLWYWTNPLFVNWQGAGQNIPRNKIAAGVPIYGYDFAYGKDPDDLSGQVPPGYKSIRYKDILAQFPDAHTAANGNIKVSGSTPRPPFISASGSYPYTHNIYFETPDTAVTKLNFLKDVGAQGVIIWELSNDIWEEGKSIIKALYRNSGNPESRTPIPALSIIVGSAPVPKYRIVNVKSRMAITAPTNKGEGVYQSPVDSSNPLQVFEIQKDIENTNIRCAGNPSLVLDVQGDSGKDQTPIIVWTENGNLGQRFRFEKLTITGSGPPPTHETDWVDRYLIHPNSFLLNPKSFRLAVSGGSTETNAPIVQDAQFGVFGVSLEDDQKWDLYKVANDVSSRWIEVRGENSYCYCVCNRASSKHQWAGSRSDTMNIEAGAPYFYAVFTKDDDTVDFPTGAILTIQDPDGNNFDRDIQEENLLVIMSGSSVRCLIVKNPKPGNWKMTMTVPEGVGFHCECNTVPSKDPYKTITTAHRSTNQLHKRDISDDKRGWVGPTMVANITASAGVGFILGGPVGELLGATIGALVNGTMLAYMAEKANHPVADNAHLLRSTADAISQQPNITANVVRIATWNVFHNNLQDGVDPDNNRRPQSTVGERVDRLVNYGSENNIDLIAFQEIPQAILNDPNHQIFVNIANTRYEYIIVNNEYPPRPNINAPAPASATTDGYLILYNRDRLTLMGMANGQYFNPEMFLQGTSQSRPPVQLQFDFPGGNTFFNFLTWHTEPQHHIARDGVAQAVNLLNQQQGNWIIAGDLNIYENELPEGVVDPHHLTHYPRTLDHIITSGTVVDPHQPLVIGPNGIPVVPIMVSNEQWGGFWSDHHYVLFGIAWF